MSSSPWTHYLRWMLSTLAVTLAVVGGVNILIDPLGVVGAPRIDNFNAIKPYLDHHRDLARWQAARRACASVGIFGNSRAEIGFDPENPTFAAHGLTAFNHAIPGSGAIMAYRQLNWLDRAGCMPKTIILGVDFFDFLGGSKPTPLPTPEIDPPPRLDGRFLAETVFSITGLKDSLGTIMLQRTPHPAILTERGFNPMDNYLDEVARSGHYLLFRQRAEENLRNWTRKAPRLRPEEGGISSDEQEVEAFLTHATGAGSSVHLVIYPYHAEIRMMLERIGLGELFSDWKRNLLATTVRAAKGHATVKLWDFSAITPETLEEIPALGDHKTNLRYYWEAGHFKKALGDLALAQMLGDTTGFGVELNPANIDTWLTEDRTRVKTLLAQPSPLLTEVDDVLRKR